MMTPEEPTGAIVGRVLFPDGTPVVGAKVVGAKVVEAKVGLSNASGQRAVETSTDARGRFEVLGLAPGLYRVAVEHDSVAAAERRVQVPPGREVRVELVLAVAGRRESVTVTATLDPRQAAGVPSSVAVLDGERLRNSPGVTLDEVLRAIPGFSLFRRTSSLAAHPTAQGLSLRGVGPSGTSRSLVLVDGFPANDLFGGWVYWNRVPREALASAEVLRGAASSLYGNAALAGVASILSERPQRRTVRASLAGGSTGLLDTSWFASTRSANQRWGVSLDGEAFRNDGYYAVRRRDRGAADAPFALAYLTARLRLERELPRGGWAFASAGVLTEDRENGTRLRANSTDLRYGSLGAQWHTSGGSTWRAGLFAQGETFRSTFSRLSGDRNQETLTLSQRVPSNSVMARADWSRPLAHHHLTAGGDLRWVEGASHEQSFGRQAIRGGRQWTGGLFVQDVFTPAPAWQVVASVRADRWSSTDRATGRVNSATVLNPQLGLRYQVFSRVALRAQGYRGFRGPTLNELYRQFRVGNVLTLANSSLRPERANGAEAGTDVQLGTSLLRLTGFWTELRDPVSNVTLSIEQLILRQRQNVGRTRIRGLEADWEWRFRRKAQFRLSYLFDDARVRRFAPDPGLEGLRLPQVARHQGFLGLQLPIWRGGILHLQTRLSGVQFDDDRNQLPLAGFAQADLAWTQPLGNHLEWFLRASNLFDRRYPVARTPLETLAAPRLVLVGVRFRWNDR